MAAKPIAELQGTSEQAGSRVPQHVMIVDPSGNVVAVDPTTAWSSTHRPAANTQATIAKAAAGVGKRLVCTSLTVTYVAGAAAPAAAVKQVSLYDGTNAGTVLWGTTLGVPAVAGATNGACPQGPWVGSQNTQMLLEFEAAGGANTVESVTMNGYVVTA